MGSGIVARGRKTQASDGKMHLRTSERDIDPISCLVELLARKEFGKRTVIAFVSFPFGHALDVMITPNEIVLLASLFSECRDQNIHVTGAHVCTQGKSEWIRRPTGTCAHPLEGLG